MYRNASTFIDGTWTAAAFVRSLSVVSPVTGETIDTVAMPSAPIWIERWKPQTKVFACGGGFRELRQALVQQLAFGSSAPPDHHDMLHQLARRRGEAQA
jgi:hypothetical protein